LKTGSVHDRGIALNLRLFLYPIWCGLLQTADNQMSPRESISDYFKTPQLNLKERN